MCTIYVYETCVYRKPFFNNEGSLFHNTTTLYDVVFSNAKIVQKRDKLKS